MARSTERLLKKGNQTYNEMQINDYIESIADLFTYMEDKDLFIEVYRWGLARRLLDNKIASIDYEKSLIGRIKMIWGPQYTSKVEGMLTDLNTEAESIREFQQSGEYGNLTIEFDLKVLTDGYWPSFKSPPMVLPAEMSQWTETFNKYYTEKNKMKNLSWSYMHGNCTVSAVFGTKTYNLILTTYQTSIVVLFNTHNELSFTEMNEILKTDEQLLKNMLQSLSWKRYKILAKTGDPKIVTSEDTFSVNEKFQNRLRVITIAAPAIKETFNKEKYKIDIDRTHAVDACIVKIMKSRKKMSYMHLLNEVMSLLQMFKPTSTIIKNRIESLIERDYMERDSENSQIYRYLA